MIIHVFIPTPTPIPATLRLPHHLGMAGRPWPRHATGGTPVNPLVSLGYIIAFFESLTHLTLYWYSMLFFLECLPARGHLNHKHVFLSQTVLGVILAY